jgi:hypothetical protein
VLDWDVSDWERGGEEIIQIFFIDNIIFGSAEHTGPAVHSIGLESGRSAAAACSRIFKQYGTLTIARTAFVFKNTASKARFDILGKARGQIRPLDDESFSQ